jgi:hypothetical protein
MSPRRCELAARPDLLAVAAALTLSVPRASLHQQSPSSGAYLHRRRTTPACLAHVDGECCATPPFDSIACRAALPSPPAPLVGPVPPPRDAALPHHRARASALAMRSGCHARWAASLLCARAAAPEQ